MGLEWSSFIISKKNYIYITTYTSQSTMLILPVGSLLISYIIILSKAAAPKPLVLEGVPFKSLGMY